MEQRFQRGTTSDSYFMWPSSPPTGYPETHRPGARSWPLAGLLIQPAVVRAVFCHFPHDSPGWALQLSAFVGCDSRTKPHHRPLAGGKASLVAAVYATRYRLGCLSASLMIAALQAYGIPSSSSSRYSVSYFSHHTLHYPSGRQ